MIRKPAETEFRDTALVNVVRGSRKIAVESGKSLSKGIARIYLLFLACTFGFGLLTTLVSRLGSQGWLGILAVAVLVSTVYKHLKRPQSTSSGFSMPAQASIHEPRRNVGALDDAFVAPMPPSPDQSLDGLRQQARPFGRRTSMR